MPVFPWAKFRTVKGAVKLHIGLNHAGHLPEFVTRLKSNTKYRVIEHREVLQNKGLNSDQVIEFTGPQIAKKCPIQLRRIGYRDQETGKHYVFLTNNFKLAAKTITDIYKARWQVELFFK